jgi:hypothetical protein
MSGFNNEEEADPLQKELQHTSIAPLAEMPED